MEFPITRNVTVTSIPFSENYVYSINQMSEGAKLVLLQLYTNFSKSPS